MSTLDLHGVNKRFSFQLIYSVVSQVSMHQPIAYLHLSAYKQHTTHNSWIRSDEFATGPFLDFSIRELTW